MNEQNIYNEPATLTAELQEAAFEYLLLNPGSEFGDWKQGLISEYHAEVVDALGNNPTEVNADLADMWEQEYTDPKTGLSQKYSEWAMSFANEYAVGVYYFLVDACKDLTQLGHGFHDVTLMSKNRQVPCDNPLRGGAQAAIEDLK